MGAETSSLYVSGMTPHLVCDDKTENDILGFLILSSH
jgi:hypothetical protein